MSGKKLVLLLTAALFAATLWGCGSNRDSGGDPTVSPEGGDGAVNAQNVGMDVCTNCHAGQTAAWLDGYHGNMQIGHSATDDLDASGFPDYAYLASGECATCHDPLGDGENLVAGVTGNVPRPVVGCESCHGGGSMHYGLGPMPVPSPGIETCGTCHNSTFDHNKYHPEGDNIVEDVLASKHFTNALNSHVVNEDGSVRAKCSKCHSDEGARRFKTVATGNRDALGTAFEGVADLPAATPIQCRTCHDPHKPLELLHKGEEGVMSAEFATCTSCHETQDGYHGEGSSHSWSGGTVGEGTFEADRVIYDTHFDDPATATIEGYNIDPANERACRDCHNVHSGELTINGQWAASRHAGGLLEAKQADGADPMTAGVTEGAFYGPAADHDWKNETGCLRCHTSTGAKFYMDAVATQNDSKPDNDVVFDAAAAAADMNAYMSAEQQQVLYCSTCHTDSAGGIRNPGVITTDYGIALPDAGASNTCVACHSGRKGGVDVTAGASRYPNSHYLPAGGVLFGAVGYEYAGIDPDGPEGDLTEANAYDDVRYFKHAKIGLADENGAAYYPGTGDAGPCAGCHMSEDTGHSFEPILTDAQGNVTLPAVCSACHNTTDPAGKHFFSAQILVDERHEYHSTISMLGGALAATGHPYLGHYPYFNVGSIKDASGTVIGTYDWTNDGTYDDAKLLGAAFNFGLLHHEPGGYAHNRYYAKRLLFDSLDYIDNAALDQSVDLDALDSWIKANASSDALTDAGYDAAALDAVKVWLGADENGVAKRP